jgi:hypothetical protein
LQRALFEKQDGEVKTFTELCMATVITD